MGTTDTDFKQTYLDTLTLVEKLHRLLLDVIKDEFKRIDIPEINPTQALLMFNIGDNEVTAGELRSRGYYQGSNVSYHLKKLVELDYIHHKRCKTDRRSVRVRLTKKGFAVHDVVSKLFSVHVAELQEKAVLDMSGLNQIATTLQDVEQYWIRQIRYIY